MMKKINLRAISCLLAVMLVMASVMIAPIEVSAETPPSVIADGECGDNLTWTLDDSGTLTVSGTGDMWDFDPPTVGFKAHPFQPWCKYYDKIITVQINDGVTNIGEVAFLGCRALKDVAIPDSVMHIRAMAFVDCGALTDITLPSSLKSIGYRAFSGCSLIESVTIPNSVTSIIESAFAGCSALTIYGVAGSYAETYANENKIPFAVEAPCEDGAHIYGEWTRVTEPTYTEKGSEKRVCTRKGCGASETRDVAPLEVPSPSIIADGKCGENLTWTLDDNGTLTISGTGDMWNSNLPITGYPSQPLQPWRAYYDKIITVQINDGVTSIGKYAFYHCDALESITLPNSVTNIGDEAFFGCSALESIIIPDGVTSIGDWAFYNCSALTSITIPDSVTSIGEKAFFGCNALESITIPDSVTNIEDGVFECCSTLKNIQVDENNPNYTSVDGVLYTKDKTSLLCFPAGKQEIRILDGVTSIGNYAFSGCSALPGITTSITIPDTVTSIGKRAFNDFSALESITLPDSVTSIGEYAFSDCRALRSVTLSNSMTSIGDMAFLGCGALTNITIPNSVKVIGYNAFLDCGALETVTIPDSVTSIGYCAFDRCDKLTIYGASGSCAEKYAKENNIPFRSGVFVGDRFFLDVKPGTWYLGAVEYALDNGLFFGVSPKMFAPDVSMNRAMLVTVLWRMEGEPAVSEENPFNDVSSGEWYTDAVKWASANGIVYGISKDKYDPMADITREQAAAILYRYSQYKEYDVSKTADLAAFPDGNETSDYAVTELSWAYAEGLITGVKKGKTDYLEPQGNATRAQVATILMRYKESFAK